MKEEAKYVTVRLLLAFTSMPAWCHHVTTSAIPARDGRTAGTCRLEVQFAASLVTATIDSIRAGVQGPFATVFSATPRALYLSEVTYLGRWNQVAVLCSASTDPSDLLSVFS